MFGLGTLLTVILQGISGVFASGGAKDIKDIIKTVGGDKAAVEQYSAQENVATKEQFAKEFQISDVGKSWFNGFMDGVNRLPRPVMTFGALALPVWACVDPQKFAVAMTSLSLMPQMCWNAILMVWGFYFSSRLIENLKLNGSYDVPAATRALAEKVAAATAIKAVQPLLTPDTMLLSAPIPDPIPAVVSVPHPDLVSAKPFYSMSNADTLSRAHGWVNPVTAVWQSRGKPLRQ